MTNRVIEDEQSYKLMYKAFETSLITPTNDQLAKAFLSDGDCNKYQSENNFLFLERVVEEIVTFLKENELEYEKYNNSSNSFECDCDYNCECRINDFLMPAFENLASKFEPCIHDDSLINRILEEYEIEEKERFLSRNLLGILNLILYKGLAYLAFDHGFYDVSCWHHEVSVVIYGASVANDRFNPSEYIESELSARAKKANEARWQGHVEKQRRKYLELDKQRQSELGKSLNIKSVATWIYEHHNQDDLEYETIRDHLSKARKGIFTND